MPVSLNAEIQRKKERKKERNTPMESVYHREMNNLLHTNKSQKGQLFGYKRRDFFSIWV